MKLLISAVTGLSMVAAAPVMAADWTGAYAGFGVGYGDTDGPGTQDGDNATFGGHIGYNYDFGNNIVVGAELEYDRVGIDLGGAGGSIDNIGRFKLKGGYDFGPALGYAVVGAARADTSFGNDTGAVYGIGMAFPVTDQWTVSGEVLRHDFSNLNGSGSDFDTNTFNLRASFRF